MKLVPETPPSTLNQNPYLPLIFTILFLKCSTQCSILCRWCPFLASKALKSKAVIDLPLNLTTLRISEWLQIFDFHAGVDIN